MKKTLLFFISLFSISTVFSQSNCQSAQEVMLNTTTVAPAYAGETGTPPTLFCGLNNNNSLPTKGKWYKFTAIQNIEITISTVLAVNNNSDTRLLVYSGDCANLTCLVANDDFSGGLTSQVSFSATANVTYIFAFDNRYSSNGFSFTVNEAPPPAPDRLSFTSEAVAGITGNYNNCVVDMNGDYLDDIVSPISTTSLAISKTIL
jgi:hypothetical protein